MSDHSEILEVSLNFRIARARLRGQGNPVRHGAMPPFAGVAELVDARDLGSRDESRGGSSPSARTTGGPPARLEHRGPVTVTTKPTNDSGLDNAGHRNSRRRAQARIPRRG